MITQKILEKLSGQILKIVGAKNAVLDIVLLPHSEMAALKWRLMKKKTEPNVLSFRHPATFPHPETKKKYLGEVFLNKDIVKKSPERAAPLLVHGILHLLGHDHEKRIDRATMDQAELNILQKLGKNQRR